MGIITLVLISAGTQPAGSGPQWWVITACAFAIAIGTYSGGWRIIRTMGSGLTEVKPAQGFAAETSTASAILASSHLGFALSTTQVASGSVIGSGMGRRGTTVRWGTAGRIAIGWLFTLPGGRNRGRADGPARADRGRRRDHRGRRRHRRRGLYVRAFAEIARGPQQRRRDRGSRPGRAVPQERSPPPRRSRTAVPSDEMVGTVQRGGCHACVRCDRGSSLRPRRPAHGHRGGRPELPGGLDPAARLRVLRFVRRSPSSSGST